MTFKWSQINIPHMSLNGILIFQIYARLSFSALLAIDRQLVLLSGLVIDNIHDSFKSIDNIQQGGGPRIMFLCESTQI